MDRARFAPERTTLVALLIAFFGALPAALSVRWLSWVLLLPVVAAVWVVRARVVADRESVQVCNGWAVRHYRWDDVDGFDVPRRGPVQMRLDGGRRVALTALPRRRLRDLLVLAPRRVS